MLPNPQASHGTHDLQNCFSRRRNVKELLHLKEDNLGYVEGRIFMTWPPRNKLHRINLEVAEGSTLYRFEVQFPYKDGIAFRPHEYVSLSLKGMKVDPRKESSSPHSFPILLRFPDGVVLKYLSGANAGKVVDTWDCTGNTDEWYNPSVAHTVLDAVTSDQHHNPTLEATHFPIPVLLPDDTNCHAESRSVNRLQPPLHGAADSTATARSVTPAEHSSTKRPRGISKRARKRRKLQKEAEPTLSNGSADDPNKLRSDVAMPCHEQHQVVIDGPPTNISNTQSTPQQTNVESSIREECVLTPQLKAGVRTQRGDIFTALGDLKNGHSMINVIGIVTSVSPINRTRTNELSRSLTLVDPSLSGIRVNCFQKKYPEWLPQVQKDDIVILRKLKTVAFDGKVTATGYGDKLRWAVYDSLRHSIRPPNKGDAPEKELTDNGMGYEFCPYLEPFHDSLELEYCRQLGEWWTAKRELEGEAVECSITPGKQHLLISEASPDLPPRGFFNCTVEVLQKFDNHDCTDVYVTDYSASTLVHSVHATWCPAELTDCVLKCTMWDDARIIAKMMNPGEYWYLHNARARWNPDHYMEGTMQLAEKVIQLDETQRETQPHFRALLLRKKEHKSSLSLNLKSLPVFPEMLLQDVDGSTSFLTCNVELLHVDFHSRDGNFVYVTDYTYNPDLPTTVSTADWAHDLDHRVVKIGLGETQAQSALDLKPGSMYTIHNLRMKRMDASGSIRGCLGGERTLIAPLTDPSNCHVQTLQRNKEKWKRENMLNVPVALPGRSGEVYGSSTVPHNTTLQEALAEPAPNVSRVLARVVDFYPFSLEDACVLRCTKCDSSPPPSFKQCPRCDDMMESHCKWFYRLFILLQDSVGLNELIVSLSGEECTLLRGVDPADFRSDREAFRRFLEKLEPVLGNLRDVHAAWSRNENMAIESPQMLFTFESWNIGDDEKGYGLLECNPA